LQSSLRSHTIQLLDFRPAAIGKPPKGLFTGGPVCVLASAQPTYTTTFLQARSQLTQQRSREANFHNKTATSKGGGGVCARRYPKTGGQTAPKRKREAPPRHPPPAGKVQAKKSEGFAVARSTISRRTILVERHSECWVPATGNKHSDNNINNSNNNNNNKHTPRTPGRSVSPRLNSRYNQLRRYRRTYTEHRLRTPERKSSLARRGWSTHAHRLLSFPQLALFHRYLLGRRKEGLSLSRWSVVQQLPEHRPAGWPITGTTYTARAKIGQEKRAY